MDKDKRVCIVTGSGAGIGKGIAETFAKNEYLTVIATLDESEGKQVEKKLLDQGYEAVYKRLDVSSVSNCRQLVDDVYREYERIDVLVNNAGITFFKEFDEVSESDWDYVMGVDLKGVFFLSQFVSNYMKGHGKGAIINIASNHVLSTLPNSELYVTAKSGVVGLTKGMALTLGKSNIRVNAISPGFTNTPHHERWMQDLNDDLEYVSEKVADLHASPRISNPEDIGKLALFLASDDAVMINGANIVIDGGLTNTLFASDFFETCKKGR